MKNIFKLSALAVLAAGLLASCQEKEIAAPEVALDGARTFTLTIAQPDTKVAVTDAGKTTWEVGDKILIHGEGETNKAIVELTAENISANGKKATITFEGVEPYDRFSDRGYTSTFYAQYPAENSEEGTNYYYYSRFTKTNGLLMAGYNQGNDFVMYNLCGVISFKANVDYDSYVFEGNGGETVGYELFVSRLAGKGEGNDPVLEWKYSHTKNPLTSIEGVGANGEVAYIGLPLGTNFTAGFKLSLKKGENVVATLTTDKAVNVERGKLLPLGDITSKLESTGVIEVDTWDYTPSEAYLSEGNLWKPVFDGNFEEVAGNIAGYPDAPVAMSTLSNITKKESTYVLTFGGATEGEWGCCNFLSTVEDHFIPLKAGKKYNLSVTIGSSATIEKFVFSLHDYKASDANHEGDWKTDMWDKIEAGTPKTLSVEFDCAADMANFTWTIIPQFGTPAGMKLYIKDLIVEEVKEPLKFAWRSDTVVEQMVGYKDPGAAHWYIDADKDVDFSVKVYLNNVETTEAVTVEKFEAGGGHVAINYAANETPDEKVWDVVVTTEAFVETAQLHGKLEQGPYEYSDLAKLNADIIAAGDKKVDRILNIGADEKLYVTKKVGKNVFAQARHDWFTGGILFYGTGLEEKVAECNTIYGKCVVTTTTYNGVPEITKVTYQEGAVTFGYDSSVWPCEKVTIAALEADYMKYVNVKTEFNNNYNGVTVTDGFDKSDRNGKIKDSTGEIALYVQLTDGTITGHVTGTKLNKIIAWPTFYKTNHQIGLWSQPTDVKSIPGVITVAETKSVAVGATVELGATTNSTGALSYVSSDEAIATVSAEGVVTGVAAGTAEITVSVAADGKYLAGEAKCTVTVTAGAVATVLYSRVGAETPASWAGTYLMVYAKNGPQVLSSISDTSTKYGVGSRVTINEDATITQTDELKACEVTIAAASDGNADHYVMMFNGKYLTWTSGNSLNVADAESDNTRWTLAVGTAATGNVIITNVADSARQLWYNESSPRFACYTGKTETTSNYAPAQLFKLME